MSESNLVAKFQTAGGDPLGFYTQSTFDQYLRAEFLLWHEGQAVEVSLVEIVDLLLPRAYRASGRESFTLRFSGGTAALPQGTYKFTHRELGTFDLFVVPVGADAGIDSYVALFNRLAYSAMGSGPAKNLDWPADASRFNLDARLYQEPV